MEDLIKECAENNLKKWGYLVTLSVKVLENGKIKFTSGDLFNIPPQVKRVWLEGDNKFLPYSKFSLAINYMQELEDGTVSSLPVFTLEGDIGKERLTNIQVIKP